VIRNIQTSASWTNVLTCWRYNYCTEVNIPVGHRLYFHFQLKPEVEGSSVHGKDVSEQLEFVANKVALGEVSP
jgi:hypothetical protein